jgi:hypothetical protein
MNTLILRGTLSFHTEPTREILTPRKFKNIYMNWTEDNPEESKDQVPESN